MTPETIGAGWILLGGSLAVGGLCLLRVLKSAIAERAYRHRLGIEAELLGQRIEIPVAFPKAAPAEPYCRLVGGGRPIPYLCTRAFGHDGDHAAHGSRGRVITTWASNVIPLQREARK